PPRSPLFPYTTLFRSGDLAIDILASLTVGESLGEPGPPVEPVAAGLPLREFLRRVAESHRFVYPVAGGDGKLVGLVSLATVRSRSEEHTSELQSPCNL